MTPFQIGAWTEEQARTAFVEYRFAKNGGEPYCEACSCVAVYTFKSRPIYKCKRCNKQFSATSGTPWAYKKLPFRTLIYLIACFNHTAQALSARELCRNLGLQYKTVLVWLHKLRAEIALASQQQILADEVEVDGAYFGGQARRKNTEKERKNQSKLHYRHDDSVLTVVAARQRGGGPIRKWIAKSEGDTRPFVHEALAPGTTLFTDMAPEWGWFRSRVRQFQINHKLAYYTPEACTNQAENVFSALRVAERTHRHIAQNYLDFYAAEVAWRIQRNKQPGYLALAELMENMSRRGKSPLAGYFQSSPKTRGESSYKKRGCLIHKFNKEKKKSWTEEWWPPSKEERKRARRNNSSQTDEKEYIPRWAKAAKAWDKCFTFIDAASLVQQPQKIPESAGVYVLFLRDGRQILDDIGFEREAERKAWSYDGAEHLYTGESYAIRTRILQHLIGDCTSSNFRQSLLALQWHSGVLPNGPEIGLDRENVEKALTCWLASQVVVGYRNCGYVKDAEAAILNATNSPLNLAGRPSYPFGLRLSEIRQRFKAEVAGKWSKPAYDGPRRRG